VQLHKQVLIDESTGKVINDTDIEVNHRSLKEDDECSDCPIEMFESFLCCKAISEWSTGKTLSKISRSN
jgi:hypothetical protein